MELKQQQLMYIYHSEHANILLNMYTGKIRKKYLNSKLKRKQLVAPTLDGFPIGSMEDEKQKWFHKKCTEQWRYNILTSNKAAEFGEKERARCKAAYHARKEKKAEASAAVGTPPHMPSFLMTMSRKIKGKNLKN